MNLENPDLYIQWYKIDEPGSNPCWESKCGFIKQVKFGDDPLYIGTLLDTRIESTSLTGLKKMLEELFKKSFDIIWEY